MVIIPYLCIQARSTVRSSLRLIGTRTLCVNTSASVLGVNLTLKLLLMPMSRRCLAKMSLYSALTSPSCFRSLSCISDPSHWNIFRIFSRDC